MKLKKFLLILMCFLFLGTIPTFADGGIPLWIYTAHTAFGVILIGEPLIAGLIWTLIILAVVIGIETFVTECIFKFKKAKRVFKTVLLGNIITAIIGTIITIIIYFTVNSPYSNDISKLIIGPYALWLNGYGLVIGNILLFLMSFIVEYYVAKIRLEDIFDLRKIKIAFLSANIVSYILPLLVTILAVFGAFSDGKQKDNILYLIMSIAVLIGTIIFVYLFIKKDSSELDISNKDNSNYEEETTEN